MLGRNLDTHMGMIRHHVTLDDPTFLLTSQLMKNGTEFTTNLPKQLPTASFRHKHHMVLALYADNRYVQLNG